MFFNTLTPKFYVALTGTSSLISGLILIFEWWYFKKYGTSFIEQVSLNYISSNSNESSNFQSNSSASSSSSSSSSQIDSNHNNNSTNNSLTNKFDTESNQLISQTNSLISSNGTSSCNSLNGACTSTSLNSIPECKVWKNPMSLFRGAEYSRLTQTNGKEPLTFYDMNLSAQDHQTFFTCDYDEGKPEYEIMQRAWRERNPVTRINLANEALNKNTE